MIQGPGESSPATRTSAGGQPTTSDRIKTLPAGLATRPANAKRVPVRVVRSEISKSDMAQVDICLVFDTTGSMSDKVEGLIECLNEFAASLDSLKLAWRISTVPFGDLRCEGDKVVGDLPFVSSIEELRVQLSRLPMFYGGSNDGESSIEAMLAGMRKPWRDRAVRVVVLLTDDSAHVHGDIVPAVVSRRLQQQQVICFVASTPTKYYQAWAECNGGTWTPISSTMSTDAITTFLQNLIKSVGEVARAVHEVAGGSVQKYLAIGGASKDLKPQT